MLIFMLILWASAIVDAAVAGLVYWRVLRGAPQGFFFWRIWDATLRALLAAGATGVFKAIIIASVVRSGLAAVHVMLLWCALVPATIGVVGLIHAVPRLRGWRRATAEIAAGLGLAAPFVCAYATLVEPYWLAIERADAAAQRMPADADPLRIVVLADVQTDRISWYERDVLARTNALEPDLILLPGDFHDGFGRLSENGRWDEFVGWYGDLRAKHGVFACLGNIDNPGETRRLFDAAGVHLLRDEIAVVEVGRTRVAIGGTDYVPAVVANPPLLRRMHNVNADVRIVMAHKPDAVLGAEPDDLVDLIVSGHTHGGQVVLPGFGPLITFSRAPRDVCAGGLSVFRGQPIYVSRGVGHERRFAPPLRFWCRPEISVLTVTGSAAGPVAQRRP